MSVLRFNHSEFYSLTKTPMFDINFAWHGDPEGHAIAGRKGGKAQGKKTNPGNFANDRAKASRAGKAGGEGKGPRKEQNET
jgi:general stress protein YciG